MNSNDAAILLTFIRKNVHIGVVSYRVRIQKREVNAV